MKEVLIDLNTAIGPQFRALREQTGITIRGMAFYTNVAESSLQHWESATGPFRINQKTSIGLNNYALKYCKVLCIETVNFKPFKLHDKLCPDASI